jgi:hypothetical protein
MTSAHSKKSLSQGCVAVMHRALRFKPEAAESAPLLVFAIVDSDE